ncbi:ribonuclease D [Leptospira sp. GIMC2001]|uniref:ribonuclease D n=1 Tax=Leptospira sp. GIMC2001 TaxID=1513297 RepID=UPI00234A8B16|nr:ribonuclease H-like domain-containing protein [Leptospira sp. GIMC2001]WCL48234.1 ribonuclease D [Leptospira sp. GIMC2001]
MSQKQSSIRPLVFQGDLSEEITKEYEKDDHLAVDCEMMGLNPRRDRLCVIQICDSKNKASLVQILPGQTQAPNIQLLFEKKSIIKIFHFGRMDLTFLKARLGISVNPVFCTKIASKLARTYTDKHGLKELVKEFFDESMDKGKQSSDWGKKILSKEQLEYAAGDVKYLIALKHILTEMLVREGRLEYADKCYGFLGTLVDMDLLELKDIFEH